MTPTDRRRHHRALMRELGHAAARWQLDFDAYLEAHRTGEDRAIRSALDPVILDGMRLFNAARRLVEHCEPRKAEAIA